MTLLLSLFVVPAFGQQAKLDKAQKFYDRYDGTAKFLGKAYDSVADARVHIETRDQAATWVLYADIAKEYAMNPDLKSPWEVPMAEAIRAYDTALGKDGADRHHEHVLEGVLTLESVANTRLVDAYEREDHETAWAYVRPLINAHGIVRQIGRLDPNREIAVLQYATLTALELDKHGEAIQFHKELDAVGGRKSGTTKAVADALKAKDPAEALKFVSRWSKDDPSDAVLLQARFDLLFEAEQSDQVKALLDEHAGDRGSAIAITMVHARALERTGQLQAASDTYDQAVQLQPSNQEALREHADLLVKLAEPMVGDRKQKKQLEATLAKAIERLEASIELDNEHLPTHEKLLALYQRTEADAETVAKVEKRIQELR